MAQARRRGGNPVYIVVISLLVVLIAVLMIILFSDGTEEITDYGSLSVSAEYQAIIVRDEISITAGNYDKTSFFVREGAYVNAGDHVIDVFKRGYNEELMISLQQTRNNIYAVQMELLGEARDSTLESLNASINALNSRLNASAMQNSGEDILIIQAELEKLLSERREHLRSVIHETEQLRALYAEEAERELLVDAWRESLYAERDGVVSFYFDDYEYAINADKLSTLTAALVSSAIKGKDSVDWTTQSQNLAFRIVDNTHWYCVFVTDSSDALRVAKGHTYEVEISGYGMCTAIGMESIINGKSIVNILEINADMGALINVRGIDIKVAYSASGIKVQRDAIQISDGQPRISLMFGSGREEVDIDVLTIVGKYAIIRSKDESSPISAGVRYWIP